MMVIFGNIRVQLEEGNDATGLNTDPDNLDEDVDTTLCKGTSNCLNQQQCLTHELWESLSSEIYVFLSSISLSSIAQTETAQSVASRQDNEQLHNIEILRASQIN